MSKGLIDSVLDQIFDAEWQGKRAEKLTEKLREKYDLHTEMERLRSDEENVPEKDAGFLRK